MTEQHPVQMASAVGRKCDISVVVPVYQEERMIPIFLSRLLPVVEKIGSYEVIFCVDPGRDRTVQVIEDISRNNPRIGMLLFSRRFGQPAATMAGILNCSGDVCVIIDVDLQDPPDLIPQLYDKLKEGNDVVYAQRRSRKGETVLKSVVSNVGYSLINAIAEVEIPRNTGDFRIINRRVIDELRKLKETHGFLRGLVAFVGFRQACVVYDRDPRAEGEGKYNRFTGSLKIGFNGIVAYSTKPLSVTLWVGLATASVSFLLAVVMVCLRLFSDYPYPLGIPTITVLVLFLGGVQLISLGIIGEYVGRIYNEVRQRPMFIVDRHLNVEVKNDGRAGAGSA